MLLGNHSTDPDAPWGLKLPAQLNTMADVGGHAVFTAACNTQMPAGWHYSTLKSKLGNTGPEMRRLQQNRGRVLVVRPGLLRPPLFWRLLPFLFACACQACVPGAHQASWQQQELYCNDKRAQRKHKLAYFLTPPLPGAQERHIQLINTKARHTARSSGNPRKHR